MGDLAKLEQEISKLKKALAAKDDCPTTVTPKIKDSADLRDRVKGWTWNQGHATTLFGEISEWDTSEVTDMQYLFSGADAFNQDISKWDTGKVTDFTHMFHGALSMTETYKPPSASFFGKFFGKK